MTRSMKPSIAAMYVTGLLGLLAWFATSAFAAVPEGGFYVDNERPGLGFAIEVQQDRVGLVIYAYGEDGEPEFLTAGGTLTVIRNPSEFPLDEIHLLNADLYRSDGGYGFLSVERPTNYREERIGEVSLQFGSSAVGTITINIQKPVAGLPVGTRVRSLTKLSFGFGAIGDIPRLVSNGCWPDLRGEWVFVNAVAEEAAPIRVKLSTVEDLSPNNDACSSRSVKRYEDIERGITLTCVNSENAADFPNNNLTLSGCELRDASSTPLLSFSLGNMGLTKIQARMGGLPPPSSRLDRTGEVIGFRVK